MYTNTPTNTTTTTTTITSGSRYPPLPPLPVGYGQRPTATVVDAQRPQEGEQLYRPLQLQRHLSKSLGCNLQQQCRQDDVYGNTLDSVLDGRMRCLSAGDLLGKSHEQLLLLLIQLKRNQSQLGQAIDQLRVQMESEQKMALLDPMQVEVHQRKGEELHRRLFGAEKQFAEQMPIIVMIENAIRVDYQQRQATSSTCNIDLASNRMTTEIQSARLGDRTCETMIIDPSMSKSNDDDHPHPLERGSSLEADQTYQSNVSPSKSALSTVTASLQQSLQLELDSIEKAIQGLTAKRRQLMENLKKNEDDGEETIEDLQMHQHPAQDAAIIELNSCEPHSTKSTVKCSNKTIVKQANIDLNLSDTSTATIDHPMTVSMDDQDQDDQHLQQAQTDVSEMDDLRTDNLSEMDDDFTRYENEFVQTLKAEHEQSQRMKAAESIASTSSVVAAAASVASSATGVARATCATTNLPEIVYTCASTSKEEMPTSSSTIANIGNANVSDCGNHIVASQQIQGLSEDSLTFAKTVGNI